MNLDKALRTVQNYVPGGRDGKEALARMVRRLRRKPHEPDFAVLRHFPPGQLLVDVGGNYGQSVTSMRLMQPNAAIVSYEANADLAKKVAKLFRFDQQVTIEPFGLSDVPGEFDLFVPYYRDFSYPGLASLYEEEARSWLCADKLYFFRPQNLKIRRIRCRIETLDSQSLNPYFVKIDVQGAELNTLRGAHSTLSRSHPILLIERPERDPRIVPMLSSLGYLEFEYANGQFLRRSSRSTNSFFLTHERKSELCARNPWLFPPTS